MMHGMVPISCFVKQFIIDFVGLPLQQNKKLLLLFVYYSKHIETIQMLNTQIQISAYTKTHTEVTEQYSNRS